jgi:hypothetical protein
MHNAGFAAAEVQLDSAAAQQQDQLQPYVNSQQQYRMSVPTGWEKKDKAGEPTNNSHMQH